MNFLIIPLKRLLSTDRRLVILFLSLMLDYSSLFILVPIFARLMVEISGDAVAGAYLVGVNAAIWAVMHFIFAPILGQLSDAYGRRWVLLGSIALIVVSNLLSALAPSIGLFLLARTISGIPALYGVANSYIADFTKPKDRAKAFGFIGSATSLGIIIGPIIGGYFGEFHLRLPLFVAAGLGVINFLLALWGLPETLPVNKRHRFKWSRIHPFDPILWVLKNPALRRLSYIQFFYYFMDGVYGIFALYTLYYFNWSLRDFAFVLMLVGIGDSVVQIAITHRIVARIGEGNTLILGLIFGIIAFIGIGMTSSSWVFLFFTVVPKSLFYMMEPAIQAISSTRVSEREQGRLQGAFAGIYSIGNIISPLIFTALFTVSMLHKPVSVGGVQIGLISGLPMYAAALFLIIALVIAWPFRKITLQSG